MKRLSFFITTLAIISFMACGPSANEETEKKRIDDSLFEADRNNVLDNADKILLDTAASSEDTTVNSKTNKK